MADYLNTSETRHCVHHLNLKPESWLLEQGSHSLQQGPAEETDSLKFGITLWFWHLPFWTLNVDDWDSDMFFLETKASPLDVPWCLEIGLLIQAWGHDREDAI